MNPLDNFSQVAVADVAHAIELSLAPVFLLNGIGVLLAMLTSRLARIVDRARVMESQLSVASEEGAAQLNKQLGTMRRRAKLMNLSISLSTIAALMVAAVVALLFAAALSTVSLGTAIAMVFIVSMLCLVGSLCCFLWEVQIATRALRIGSLGIGQR